MHISKLNEKFDIEFKTNLDLHIKPIEKNWVPFNDGNNFMFAYGLVPHKIMMLKNFKKNDLHHLTFENNPCLSRFYWNFGDPRGGTPAKLVDDSYLAFFHSSFGKNKKKMNYVMGAYIFDKNPPYKIKKISNFPIFFESFDKTRIVFPAGFVIKKIYGKDYIYLSLGINDSSSKILVIDKEKLFSHMKDVN
ncbi:MAG: hypothetical protein A2888_03275 [Chlamydiae bacterium RIFCSPLOWO2_01_FULL_28_7]|nr:MAG: hypothetical protein A2888_03275 [Chlamydiae bacterium RIFCSPLOWO2_01_FULL_28_7]